MTEERRSKRPRSRGRLAGAMALATATAGLVVAATGTPAWAWGTWDTQPNGVAGVRASGTHDLDTDSDICTVYATIWDTRADGHRAGVRIRVRYDDGTVLGYAYIENTSGNGHGITDYVTVTAAPFHNLDIQEYVAEGPPGTPGRYIATGGWNRICQ